MHALGGLHILCTRLPIRSTFPTNSSDQCIATCTPETMPVSSEHPAGKVGATIRLGPLLSALHIFHWLGDHPSFNPSSYSTILGDLRIASRRLFRDVFKLLHRTSKAGTDAYTA